MGSNIKIEISATTRYDGRGLRPANDLPLIGMHKLVGSMDNLESACLHQDHSRANALSDYFDAVSVTQWLRAGGTIDQLEELRDANIYPSTELLRVLNPPKEIGPTLRGLRHSKASRTWKWCLKTWWKIRGLDF